jgi:hypothetical protein
VVGTFVLVIAGIAVAGHYRREHRRAQVLRNLDPRPVPLDTIPPVTVSTISRDAMSSTDKLIAGCHANPEVLRKRSRMPGKNSLVRSTVQERLPTFQDRRWPRAG